MVAITETQAVTQTTTSVEQSFKDVWNESGVVKRVGLAAGLALISPFAGLYLAGKKGLPIVSEKVVEPVVHVVFDTIPTVVREKVAPPLHEHVIEPTGRALEAVAKPIADQAKKVGELAYEHLVVPAAIEVKKAATLTNEKVIVPAVKIAEEALTPVAQKIEEGVSFCGEHVIKPGATLAYEHVLAPAGRGVALVTKEAMDHVVDPTVEKIGRGFQVLKDEVYSPVYQAVKSFFTASE